jgi:hypothetical protein
VKPRRSRIPILAAALAAVLAAGCGSNQARLRVGHYLDPAGGVLRTSRIAFVPLVNGTDFPGVEEGMTTELLQALQTRRLFRVSLAPPASDTGNPWCRPSGQAITLRELADMRKAFRCDAVLVGTVTAFRPYPHLQGGLYLRLVDLRDGRLLWAVDHTWDASDRRTQQRIGDYYRRSVESGDSPLQWRIALVSSRAFQKFIAQEVAETLPDGEADR